MSLSISETRVAEDEYLENLINWCRNRFIAKSRLSENEKFRKFSGIS